MYFLVYASPPKPLDTATVYMSHYVEDTGQYIVLP